jgi:hypothetical protein
MSNRTDPQQLSDTQLDSALQQAGRGLQMPAERRAALLALTWPTEEHQAEEPTNRYFSRKWFSSVAIAALLVIGFWLAWPASAPPEGPSRSEISELIAGHYLMNKPSKVFADNIGQLGASLDRLDFQARLPSQLDGMVVLDGAKYCSIGGQIAMQVRLHPPEGDIGDHLLYVTRFLPQFDQNVFYQERIQTDKKAVHVTAWNDNDLFFALASNKSPLIP